MTTLKSKIYIVAFAALAILATSAYLYDWYSRINQPLTSKKEYIRDTKQVSSTEKIKRVMVPIEKVVTIEKKVLVEKIVMPDWFRTDTNKQAIATAVISPYKGKTNTIAVLDTSTGVGEIIVKQEPISFIGLENDKELYAKFGYSTAKQTQVSIGVRWLLGRVGNVKLGVYGEGRADLAADSTKSGGEASAGVILTFQ